MAEHSRRRLGLGVLLQRFGYAHLPGDLGYLWHGWIIGLACGLSSVEFTVDKIPAIDIVWDAVHTFIRVPAGAILAASAFAHLSPGVRLAAHLIGGGVASVHSVPRPPPAGWEAISAGSSGRQFGQAVRAGSSGRQFGMYKEGSSAGFLMSVVGAMILFFA